MRKALNFLLVGAMALLWAGSAGAAALTSGSFSLGLGALTPPPITAVSGSGTSVAVSSTATIGAGVIVGTATITGITASPPITQVQLVLTGHAAGSFKTGAGPFSVATQNMPLAGLANIKAYGGAVTLVAVPLAVAGATGALTTKVTTQGIGFIQATGTGWTTGSAKLSFGLTTIGGKTDTMNISTVTVTGFDARSAGGMGSVQLLSPLVVRTNLAGDIPTFGVLTLNYGVAVPEPGTLLLLGAGVAGLAYYSRKRRS